MGAKEKRQRKPILGKGSGLSPGPSLTAQTCPPVPPAPPRPELVATPTLLVARLLSLRPKALSSRSTGPLDFMVSGRLGCWRRDPNNAGDWPGASWKRLAEAALPLLEGGLSGW